LYEIARTFGTSLNVEHTLEILVDKVGHVVPFDTCIVYIYDDHKGYATARHVVGKNAQKLAVAASLLAKASPDLRWRIAVRLINFIRVLISPT
jgi:GAF domain-containing protein